MAITIPVQRTQTQVGQTQSVATQRSAADYGAGLYDAVGKVAGVAQERFNEEQIKRKKQNDLAIVQEKQNELTKWDIEQRALLSQAKGKNAPEVAAKYQADFQAKVKEIGSVLLDEDQKRAFTELSGKAYNRAYETSTFHAVSEMDKFRVQENKAYVTNMGLLATESYQNAAQRNEYITNGIDSTKAFMRLNGASDEAISIAVREFEANTHSAMVQAALTDKNYGQAKALFYAADERKIFDGTEAQAKLKAAVDAGGELEMVQSATDSVMALNLTEREALAKVRKEYTGKERDNIVQRVKVRYSEQKNAEVVANKERSFNTLTQIENGAQLDVETDPLLTEASKVSLRRYQDAKASGTLTTDTTKRMTLDSLATDKPDIFMNTDLVEYRGYLSDTDYQKYQALQNELIQTSKERGSTKEFIPGGLYSDVKMVDNVAMKSKIDKKADPAYYLLFTDEVNRAFIEGESAKGAKLTDQEKLDITSKIGLRFATGDDFPTYYYGGTVWGFRDTIKPGEITPQMLDEQEIYVDISGTSNEREIEITEGLLRLGKQATQGNIDWYIDKSETLSRFGFKPTKLTIQAVDLLESNDIPASKENIELFLKELGNR